MGAIRNKKSEPLSAEQVKELFPDGISVLACDDGVCLICKRDPKYDKIFVLLGGEDSADYKSERWWADFTDLLKGQFLPSLPTMRDRAPFEDEINSTLLGIKTYLII